MAERDFDRKEEKLGLDGEDVRRRNEGPGLAGLFAAMGDRDADALTIAESEDGRLIGEYMGVMRWPEDSEESRAFWREQGFEKTVHGAGPDRWSCFVPRAAASDPERRFPLIFCLHGAHNPIQLTESYGVMQMAAREECVVIAPENENEEMLDGLLRYALEELPADPSRIYLMGYSFGGFMASRHAMARPERFAGAAMGGMLFAGDVAEHPLDGQDYPAYSLTEDMLRRAEDLGMPALLFMGENEMLRLLPLWKEPEGGVRDGVIPLGSRDKQEAFNRWRRVGGCAPTSFLSPGDAEEDEVEARIGARFERTEIRRIRGRRYFIGDSVTEGGECLFRTAAAEGMVHWPTAAFAELAWEHLRKFARDPGSGRLIRRAD